jgi:hypothetical protein
VQVAMLAWTQALRLTELSKRFRLDGRLEPLGVCTQPWMGFREVFERFGLTRGEVDTLLEDTAKRFVAGSTTLRLPWGLTLIPELDDGGRIKWIDVEAPAVRLR